MSQKTTKITDGDTTINQPKAWRTKLSPDNVVPVVTEEQPMKKMFRVIYGVATIFLLYKLGVVLYERKVAVDLSKKETACPTLLSISRSARDTLLVMRSEPLCAIYVLDNIQ